MNKRPSIAPKPVAKEASVEKFVNGAAASDTEPKQEPAAKSKKQIPLMIPPALLAKLDDAIASKGSGTSRSVWICEAIIDKMKADGFASEENKKAVDA